MRISDWSSDVCSSDLGPARLDGPSRHHRNAHMSLVESPVRQATHAPRFQPTGYAPELPARAATTALRGHVDLLLTMRHAGVRSVRIAFEAIGAAEIGRAHV